MIIPRHEYDKMKYIISEQKTVIDSHKTVIDSQKEIIYDLIEENKALRSLVGTKDIDFPNSHPAVEPDTRDQWR